MHMEVIHIYGAGDCTVVAFFWKNIVWLRKKNSLARASVGIRILQDSAWNIFPSP